MDGDLERLCRDRHAEISAELRRTGDEELLRRLSATDVVARGHTTLSLPPAGVRVFVKLVPLTALELEPRHRHSTANLFDLPICYHYRIGGCGHGAWRELETHRIANRWVLSGECRHFPLLYGWRVLPLTGALHPDFTDPERWGNDRAIRKRIAAVTGATSSLALFLEYVPTSLTEALRERDTWDPVALESETREILGGMRRRGVLHMDAHFENVLTDGTRLYLGDFGLAISRSFDLDAGERAFFDRHLLFDDCTAITSVVHAVVSRHDPRDPWRQALRDLFDGTHPATRDVAPAHRAYLERRAPLVFAVGQFYDRLRVDLRTEFPAAELQRLLADVT